MPMLDSQPGLIDALKGEMTPKFLATVTVEGVPNVVPVTSIMPAGDAPDRLIFGNFLLRKSVDNLDANPLLGILVITQDLEGWVLQGDFQGWQRAGAYVDKLNSTDLLRYNAYTGIRNAGIIEVRAVLAHVKISKLEVLRDYVLARLARRPVVSQEAVALPAPARQRFAAMTKVGVLAYVGQATGLPAAAPGYPVVAPVLSLQPAGGRALVCAEGRAAGLLAGLSAGAQVAANLLTMDVVSFQVRGRWLGEQRRLGVRLGAMSVTEVYAGGPPMPGRRIA
jgi:hypothetical protein